MTDALPMDAVRAHFPSIGKDANYIFSENAGGSQVLGSVASTIADYLINTNVQMGDYPLAHAASKRVSQGLAANAFSARAASTDDIMIGASATQLAETLSRMIEETIVQQRAGTYKGAEPVWKEGDEIVISQADHETNRGAWKRLAARQKLVIKEWPVTRIAGASADNPYALELAVSALEPLLSERTRLVAFTACSNVLGGFVPVRAAAAAAKARSGGRAYVAVDAVAYAPHRAVRPASGEWADVDMVLWSWYKVYGPHTGALYLSPRARQQGLLTKLNHHFLAEYKGTYPYQPSSQQYELIASIKPVVEYISWLGGAGGSSTASSKAPELDFEALVGGGDASAAASQLSAAYERIAAQEQRLLDVVLPFLTSARMRSKGVRVVGSESSSASDRAPTVAFLVEGARSADVHARAVRAGTCGLQVGHMYAYALVQALGRDLHDGVVRLSLVHYNTVDEAQRLCKAIEEAIDGL